MGTRAEMDILVAQPEQFRGPQPGLRRHEKQGAIATPCWRPRVRARQQGLDFVAVEEVHRTPESFEALADGLQVSIWALGGVPREHCTHNLSAATRERRKTGGRDFNRTYLESFGWIGMR